MFEYEEVAALVNDSDFRSLADGKKKKKKETGQEFTGSRQVACPRRQVKRGAPRIE